MTRLLIQATAVQNKFQWKVIGRVLTCQNTGLNKWSWQTHRFYGITQYCRIQNTQVWNAPWSHKSYSTHIDKEDKERPKSTKPAILALKALVGIYDLLTLPLYAMAQQPRKRLALHKQIKGKKIPGKENEWTSNLPRSSRSLDLDKNNIDTLEKLFEHTMKLFANKKCLGTRPILSETIEEDASGQIVRKKELGEYKYRTYSQVQTICNQLSTGLTNVLGLKSRETIAIFADTREEWLMTAIAAFKSNLAIVTVFTTLGDEGVVHALNETEVNCLFTSDDLMSRCYDILKQTPNIRTVVYMDKFDSTKNHQIDLNQIPKNVKIISLSQLMKEAEQVDPQLKPPPRPGPDDTAIIMYTSGSTGVPKGVDLSHLNAVSVLQGMADALDSLAEERDDECYLAVLPLAHILELSSEANTFLHGAHIAYGSPYTITDASPGIKQGSKGDAIASRPTVLAVVPLVLEKISKSVQAKLEAAGGIVPDLFEFITQYKMHWIRKGYKTPLLDKYFFKKIRDVVGGNVRVIVCGGAPLAPQTEEFVRTILCSPVIIGYGLTETAGCATCCIAEDLNVGRAGSPTHSSIVRLVDWEEGGYRTTDTPYPRGELYIGGASVAKSYFKRESPDFFEENGKRWLKTGDIAEMHEDGVIKIIDRKKDLIKLSTGEYISLGKVESIFKTCPLVESVCVCGNPELPNPIAIIVPAQIQIEKMAERLGIKGKKWEELLEDERIEREFLKELTAHGKLNKLTKWEIPQGIHLTPLPWTPQSGLVTSSLKLKRQNIHVHFKSQISHLFQKIQGAQ